MKKNYIQDIEKIRNSIQVLNHNSTKIEASLNSLCKDIREFKKDFRDHKESYISLKSDVGWLKKLNFWILTSIIFGTLMGIFSGIFFLFLK